MLSGILHVVTYDDALAPVPVAEDLLEHRLRDFLATSGALPAGPDACSARTALHDLVTEAMAGETARWDKRTRRHLGDGVEANLYLWNGRALYPLQERRDFAGVTAAVPLVPDYDWVRPTGATGVTGADNATFQVFPMKDGGMVRLRGDAVRITVRSTSGLVEHASTTWAPTALLTHDSARPHLQNLSWIQNGAPALVGNLRMGDVDGLNPERETGFSLLVGGSPGAAGTRLDVHIPHDWRVVSAGDAHWSASWSDGGEGVALSFVANASVPAESVVSFFARAPANASRPFDVFTAQLGNGSFGQSSLVVRFPGAVDREVPREAFPTVPYPVRGGAYAFFGVAFANGGEALVVDQVDIEVPGGYDFARNGGRGVELFGDAELLPVKPLSEWSRLDARHVRWRGQVRLDPAEAAWWGVGVRITEDASQSTSIEGAWGNATTTTLRFGNGHEDASTLWSSSPGILRHRVPPAQGGGVGYAGGPADVGASFPFEASVEGFRARVTQPWSYTLAPEARFLQLENGVTNSSLQVVDRRAPLGSVVRAEVDVQSVMTSLAAQGVADVAVNVSVYAPPSMGCRATANWRVPAGSLPKAEAAALELWDVVPGVGSVYLAAGDEQAYRVEATGNPLWSSGLDARPAALAVASPGVLVVGDESGVVRRLDSATGRPVWSVDLGALAVTSASVAGDRVVVSTFDGRLAVLDAADGAILASFEGAPGVPFAEARLAPDGAVHAINGSLRVERFTPDLSRVATSPAPGARMGAYRAAAWTPDGLLVAGANAWVRMDAATLTVVSEEPTAAPVLHASAGDVDGDGAEDLALALEDLTIVLVDGATRRAHAFRPSAVPGSPKFEVVSAVAERQAAACRAADDPSLPREPGLGVDATAVRSRYGDPPVCTFHERNKPYALRVQDGRVAYAYAQAGQPRVCLLDDGLSVTWCRGMDPLRAPSRLSVGAFGAGRGVAVASADGTVEVRSAASGDVLLVTSPAQSVGRFAIRAPVPMGGFFGSHLLVAQVEWRDVAGRPHAVGLADWFEVVDADGSPVTAPAYRVVLVARDLALGP